MKSNKINHFLTIAAVLLISVLWSSCSSNLKPLSSNLFNANPSPLEVVGTKVPVTVNGTFPEKWFNKNAVVEITPVLKFDGQEALGTPQTYQGENVSGNGIAISQNRGGNFTLNSAFDYIPEMQKSELYLRFKANIKGKTFNLPDVKVADGVNATASLASAYSSSPSQAPDKFQRIIKEAYDADIMFLIQRAELRSSELNSNNLAAWKDLVKDASTNDRKNVDVEISAYASPDGGYKLNEGLAEKREQNTSSFLKKDFKKNNIDTEINARYTAQDWEGFKKLVEASSLQDKDLVLRVLSMYQDPEDREREIKNISLIYKDLAETILPKLRRSRLTANVEIIGKTDEELLLAVRSNKLNDLTVEELLYTATLENAPIETIYTFVTQKYPSDYRGWNNLGAFYYANNQVDRANTAFNKALQVAPRSAETNMNLALLSLAQENTSKAQELLGFASGANTLNETLGLLYIKNGDYNKAVQSFGDIKTDNAALAQILTKNYSKAQQTLDAVKDKSATTYYLSAIIAARTNNTSGVVQGLKQAIASDPAYGSYAAQDLEFAKFTTNPTIQNLLK